jgi:transposase-like protein
MAKTRRKFSPEERLSILQEGQREGQVATCRKYNLSPSLYLRWKRKYQEHGMEGLKPSYHRVDPQIRELEQENERLRKIIAKQALELEVKSELLKKTPIQPKRKWQ